jgi:hypothetical protein
MAKIIICSYPATEVVKGSNKIEIDSKFQAGLYYNSLR